MVQGDNPEIDKLQWVTGKQSFITGGCPSIIDINSTVIEPIPLSFKEIRVK